jgi:hypothetical protein
MNERLKQIMLAHGLHKYITEDCQHRMEMLAKLIVQECIDHAFANGDNIAYLKEHFGVKE